MQNYRRQVEINKKTSISSNFQSDKYRARSSEMIVPPQLFGLVEPFPYQFPMISTRYYAFLPCQ